MTFTDIRKEHSRGRYLATALIKRNPRQIQKSCHYHHISKVNGITLKATFDVACIIDNPPQWSMQRVSKSYSSLLLWSNAVGILVHFASHVFKWLQRYSKLLTS